MTPDNINRNSSLNKNNDDTDMGKKRDIIINILKKDKKDAYHLYEKSIMCSGENTYFLVKNCDNKQPGIGNISNSIGNESPAIKNKWLGIYSESEKPGLLPAFESLIRSISDSGSNKVKSLKLYPANSKNLSELKKILPHLSPSVLRTAPSFGFGDRLGIATPGHIRTINKHKGILPVFAQQSIRELTKTKRNYHDVIDSASWSVFQEGYTGKWGADADHLKDAKNLLHAIEAGCTMFTIDTSDSLNERILTGSCDLSGDKNQRINSENAGTIKNMKSLIERYSGKKIKQGKYVLKFDEDTILKLLLVYGKALDFVSETYEFIKQNTTSFDFEVSFDETKTVTSSQAHFFIANEMRLRNIDFTSLALRFPGEFFKGIDYIGNIDDFKRSIEIHGEIAKETGNYKLSLHSGSDKFSIYPDFYKYSFGNFHVKTSGTSWLEALHLIAECNPALFRNIYSLSFESFEENKKDYHLVLKLSELPESIQKIGDSELGKTLSDSRIRQCLHISYGTILDNLGKEVYEVLNENEEKHYQFVYGYLNRHLNLLQ